MVIDLHCHTRKSDNSMEIRDILSLAKSRNITHLAITDHDTTLGISEARIISKEFNLNIIPGIEISAFDFKNNKIVHILGYYINPNSHILRKLCNPIIKMRNEISKEIIKNMNREGYIIHWEEVKQYALGSSCVNKKHIMHALMKKGYCNSVYDGPYSELVSQVPNTKKYVEVELAIKAIIEAGGVPVLAHPGVFENYESVSKWTNIGLQGIESEHPAHSVEDESLCRYFSNKYNLVETGGSDFHGMYGKDKESLGHTNLGVDTIDKLRTRSEFNKIKFKAI